MKEQRMWAVVTSLGWIRTVARTRQEAKLFFIPREQWVQVKQRWRDLKKLGYRCVRVVVREEGR